MRVEDRLVDLAKTNRFSTALELEYHLKRTFVFLVRTIDDYEMLCAVKKAIYKNSVDATTPDVKLILDDY